MLRVCMRLCHQVRVEGTGGGKGAFAGFEYLSVHACVCACRMCCRFLDTDSLYKARASLFSSSREVGP